MYIAVLRGQQFICERDVIMIIQNYGHHICERITHVCIRIYNHSKKKKPLL